MNQQPATRSKRLSSRRSYVSVTRFVVTLAAVLFSAAPASGQDGAIRLHGRVLDQADRSPVAGAAIRIANVNVVSDPRGRFVASVPPGVIAIVVERIGYVSREDSLRVTDAAVSDVEIHLSKKPVTLPAIAAVARSEWLTQNGFYERRTESGLSGRYISSADIERRAPMVMTDLFHDVPGVKVQYLGMNRRLIRFNRSPPRALINVRSPYQGCDPAVFVDGQRRVDKSPTADPALDDFNFLSPIVIEAIEIYVGNAPIEFRSECGSIVIWTKRGQLR